MTTPFRILDLPAELRNAIYGYALAQSIGKSLDQQQAKEPALRQSCVQIRIETEYIYTSCLRDKQSLVMDALVAAYKESERRKSELRNEMENSITAHDLVRQLRTF